jgi:amino acid transporter
MTSTISTASAHADDADLTSLGYQPSLFVSILTTIFQLFAFGYSFAGPAFFWTWPVVLVGQLLVALNFAELAARYPLSGAVYQWSRRMGGEVVGWWSSRSCGTASRLSAAIQHWPPSPAPPTP